MPDNLFCVSPLLVSYYTFHDPISHGSRHAHDPSPVSVPSETHARPNLSSISRRTYKKDPEKEKEPSL